MKILFITATRVGDAVLSTGVLQHLLEENPNARVTIVCGPAAAGLFEAVPRLEKIIVLSKKRWSMHWVDMWLACVGTFWDAVVDLRNAPISYLLATHKSWHLGRKHMSVHRVARNGALLGMVNNPPTPKLWCTDDHKKTAERLLPSGKPIIAIAPVANWKPKSWSAENFVELIKRLTSEAGVLPGAKVMVFGTQNEREQASHVLENIPADQMIDCMGTLSLLEIYACLKRSSLFVGNDSGLMHMAAAAGVPTLGLFGPSREDLYSPWGDRAMFTRGDLDFAGVFPENYDYQNADNLELMSGLTVDRVENAATELWQRVGE
ncbi:MAG: glycosyltransferase family 9 protein [Rhodospirillales bacterium]|jgi:heptosyltransferase III|nr:glycosyltransferase family 9 protein [Rhodospirillales bacterium]